VDKAHEQEIDAAELFSANLPQILEQYVNRKHVFQSGFNGTAVKDYEELNDKDKELQCPKITIKNPSTRSLRKSLRL
jgi:hypothetical protein